MKKIFCAGLLLISALATNAQKRYVVWGNSTAVNIDAVYWGDNMGTCTPNFTTLSSYPMVPAGNLDAMATPFTGMPTPPVTVFNKVTLQYKVGGTVVSTYDIDFCTAATGYTSFTFPGGGPSLRYHFLANPANYELIIDY
jgi:hypothetical protein